MERKSPRSNFAQNYDSAFKKTDLQATLETKYENSRSTFGENADALKEITYIAGNRGLSHQARMSKISSIIGDRQSKLTSAERDYAQALLSRSQNYLQKQAEKGRIKNYSIVKEAISGLKDNIQAGSGYAQFEANTEYLDAPENKAIPVRFPKPSTPTIIPIKPASSLEKKVVTADFTPNTTPANVTPVSFLERAGKSLNRLIAVGSLVAVTAFYGLSGISCKPGPDPKDAIIQSLQAERQELGDKFTNTLANYDTTMAELMALKDKYTEATNSLATTETSLVETTSKLTQVGKDYSKATNDLNLTEEALAKKANSLAILENKKAEVERKFASTQIELLLTSNNLVNLRRDYSSATSQVGELRGYLSTAKTDSRKALEEARLTAEQLAKERQAHSETGNKLTRTTGTLEATTRDYNNALEQNKTLSANLTSSARELALERSTLADKLRELKATQTALVETRYGLDETQVGFRLLSLEHGKTARNLTEATGKYNAMAHLQGETAFKLSTTSSNLATTSRQLANTSNSLVKLTGDYKIATNDLFETGYKLFVANRELSKHDAVAEAARLAEERRLEEGRTVDALMGVSPVELPLSLVKYTKDGKRLESVQGIPFYGGDKLIDTFPELRAFARAIGNTFTSTSHVHDAIIPIWFGEARLSDTQTSTVLKEVPRQDLLRLGAFLDASKNSGKTTFTNDGRVYTILPTRQLGEIMGAKR